MRPILTYLVLLAALPACAQGTVGRLSLDVHYFTPGIEGQFSNTSGSDPINLDLKNDLGLIKDKTWLGFGAEYQGPRFGLELSRDRQDYAGQAILQRNITISGQTYFANTAVGSRLKATNNTLNWTIRAIPGPGLWVGLDLGARVTQTEINVTGSFPGVPLPVTADYKATLPVPQIGPSLGFGTLDGRLMARAMYHFLIYRRATYVHTGADVRYFPLSWLGVRAFVDSERFQIPKESIKGDLDISLNRTGAGLGVVVRF